MKEYFIKVKWRDFRNIEYIYYWKSEFLDMLFVLKCDDNYKILRTGVRRVSKRK